MALDLTLNSKNQFSQGKIEDGALRAASNWVSNDLLTGKQWPYKIFCVNESFLAPRCARQSDITLRLGCLRGAHGLQFLYKYSTPQQTRETKIHKREKQTSKNVTFFRFFFEIYDGEFTATNYRICAQFYRGTSDADGRSATLLERKRCWG